MLRILKDFCTTVLTVQVGRLGGENKSSRKQSFQQRPFQKVVMIRLGREPGHHGNSPDGQQCVGIGYSPEDQISQMTKSF